MDYVAIGRRIKAYRERLKLTQKELAELISISNVHMSHIESGNTKASIKVYDDLANFFNIPLVLLLNDPSWGSNQQIKQELNTLLENCTEDQARLVYKVAKTITEELHERPLE